MRGKHAAAHGGSASRSRRIRLTIAAVLVLSLLAVGTTMAWYAGASSLLNPFSRGEVSVVVDETFDPAVGKRDVSVAVPENASNVAAYVRAKVDIYWEDGQGKRLWDAPVAKADDPQAFDYDIVWTPLGSAGSPSAWIKGSDGSYYWTSPVEAGAKTDPLIVSCVQNVRYDDGRSLVVDVATQAIQADPARAFDTAWGAGAGLAIGQDGTVAAAAKANEGGGAL